MKDLRVVESQENGGTGFYFVVDVSIVNTYIMQGQTPHQPRMNQKEFRIELAREFLACYNSRKSRKREQGLLKERHVLSWRTIVLIPFLNLCGVVCAA